VNYGVGSASITLCLYASVAFHLLGVALGCLSISIFFAKLTLHFYGALSVSYAVQDVIFDPVTIEPSTSSVPIPLAFVDDIIPEPMKELEITINSISIENGRLGNIPVGSGSVFLDLYDNDGEFHYLYHLELEKPGLDMCNFSDYRV
jgi:hypothetical protein